MLTGGADVEPGALRPGAAPGDLHRGRTGTRSSSACSRPRARRACRCSACAAACRCSTSPSAARCVQHLPEASETTEHQPAPGDVRPGHGHAGRGQPRGGDPGRRGQDALLPPPGHRPARRRPGRRSAGPPTARSRPSRCRADVRARRAVASRAGQRRRAAVRGPRRREQGDGHDQHVRRRSTRPPRRWSRTVALTSAEETDAAIARAQAAFAGVARRRARRPRPAAAPLRRRRRRRPRAPRAAGGRQLRAHDRQRALGGGQRPRRPRLLLGRAGTPVRPADPGRRRRRRHLPRAARRGRRDRAVELPDADRRLGFRARARRRQHRRAQAGRADAADRDPAGRAGPRGRHPGGRLPGAARARDPWSGSGSSTHPAVRKVVFTGSTEVGKQIMAGCAAQVKRVTLELGGKSANIVFADADLERAAATAPYGVFDNAGQDCCARSRILVQRSVYDRFMELLEPAVHGVVVGDPAERADRDGPADLGRAPGHGGVVRARRRAGRVPRQRSRRPRLLVPADRPHPVRPATTPPSPRRSSARSSPSCRSTTRPTRSGWPTTPSTACPARSGPATSAARCASRAASRPATCRSTRTRRCATGRRSAGSSSPASAASWARTPRRRSPRPRTSFISDGGVNGRSVSTAASR